MYTIKKPLTKSHKLISETKKLSFSQGKYNMAITVYDTECDSQHIDKLLPLAMLLLNSVPKGVEIVGMDNCRIFNNEGNWIQVEFKPVVSKEHPDAV